MLKYVTFLFPFVFLVTNCTNTEPKQLEANIKIEGDTICHLLIFKKEKKAELWTVDEKNHFVDSFELKKLPSIPIGQFDLDFNKKSQTLKIQFPNEFYQSKDFKNPQFGDLLLGTETLPTTFFKKSEKNTISEIIIFPNDNRLGGELVPCFACPHWMAELHAFLNLKKNEYL